jgi:hypothetical protein
LLSELFFYLNLRLLLTNVEIAITYHYYYFVFIIQIITKTSFSFIPALPAGISVPDLSIHQIRRCICLIAVKSELPDSVQHVLPAHAQEIYKEAFNSAWEQYKHKEDRRDDASREETAQSRLGGGEE